MEKAQWVVTEKIHGANFSFHVDGDEVKVARRRAFLVKNENFFAHLDAKFMKDLPEKMKTVYQHVLKQYPDKEITQVTVWGEIFGGKETYQHHTRIFQNWDNLSRKRFNCGEN